MSDKRLKKNRRLEEHDALRQRVAELETFNAELKRIENALQQEYALRSAVIDHLGEGLCVCHETPGFPFVQFTIWNGRMTEITGYTMEEINRKGWYQTVYPDPELQARAIARMKSMRQGDDLHAEEWMVTRADGNRRVLSISSSVLESGDGLVHILALMQDMTDFKRAESALRESEERYRTILDEMEEGYQEVDLTGNYTFFNEAFLRILGYAREEMMGTNFRRYAAEEAAAQKVFRAYNRMYRTGIPLKNFELDIRRKDGDIRTLEFFASLLRDSNDRPIGFRGIVRDVTDRKRIDLSLKESEQKYRLVVENAGEAILIAQDGILQYANPITLKILGYSEAEFIAKPFVEFIHPEDREKLMEAHLRRLRGMDPRPVRQFRVLCRDGSVKWADSKAVVISWKGKPATLNFLTDITERKKAEEESVGSLARLRKVLGATVQAIAVTVEIRDPYTAGHQRRVADLARSIAMEMGLGADQADGIRMAGIIHDIGKISVPSEILSKPTPLTDLEFSLIQTHAQAGYDILKDIEFPWPIARMVLEHHEMINGSGYPNGLTGDGLLIESRILSVADVVEAIASHRPYRPGLGIDSALEEISKNRNVLYDPDVVDACLRLFRENIYQLID